MSDDDLLTLEEAACPTCGSCMFTANSMNCLVEALGLAPPGDGSTLATHTARRALYQSAGLIAVDLCRRYYEYGDDRVLPRSIATRAAFENAMTLDIAMGGEWMGDANIATTMKYLHYRPKSDAARRLGRAFS